MRTINILNEISDGNLYDIEDKVKADTCGCDNCSDCCNDVGDLVVLTPFDIYEMTTYLKEDFDKLIDEKITLRENNKIKLPYLKMQEKSKNCSFLDENKRCTIHSKRPNICRLFPLGRAYQDNDFKYFLQVDNCPKKDLKEVKISDWVNIENYDQNKEFIMNWYKFIKALTFRLKFVYDNDEINNINEILLNNFYKTKIEGNFYDHFNKILPEVKNQLGII